MFTLVTSFSERGCPEHVFSRVWALPFLSAFLLTPEYKLLTIPHQHHQHPWPDHSVIFQQQYCLVFYLKTCFSELNSRLDLTKTVSTCSCYYDLWFAATPRALFLEIFRPISAKRQASISNRLFVPLPGRTYVLCGLRSMSGSMPFRHFCLFPDHSAFPKWLVPQISCMLLSPTMVVQATSLSRHNALNAGTRDGECWHQHAATLPQFWVGCQPQVVCTAPSGRLLIARRTLSHLRLWNCP